MPPRRRTASARAPNAIDVVVGHNIRIHRAAHRMSQTDLAEQLGVSFQQVQKYEQGRNRVGGSRLLRLADVFGVPIKDLCVAPAGPEHPQGPSPLRFLAQPKALRLMQAFDQIEDSTLRNAVVALVERLAGDARM